jgi:metal-responsive CopG/Arc/MetJ family transcriptional regulator
MANPSINIPDPLLEEIDEIVSQRSEYRNRSHFIQRASEKRWRV